MSVKKAGFIIEDYRDCTSGIMENNASGKMAMTRVTLKPEIQFSIWQPKQSLIDELHHQAHDNCFIANSFCGQVDIISDSL